MHAFSLVSYMLLLVLMFPAHILNIVLWFVSISVVRLVA